MAANRRSKSGGLRGVFVTLAALVFVFGGTAFGQPWDGNGVEGDPYQIWTAEDMQAIGADANYWDAHFELMADIDLGAYTGASFNIIGTPSNPFGGIFDGGGHTILNFTYSHPKTNYVGLFRRIRGANSEVRDLVLLDPNVDAGGGTYVGCIAGFLTAGTISQCHAEGGSISGDGGSIGGLVGCNSNISGMVKDSYASCDITGRGGRAGGLVGYNGGTIVNSHAAGDIKNLGAYRGGLVGYNDNGVISESGATGNVSGWTHSGGLVGENYEGDICNCYAIGEVYGGKWGVYLGGLVGWNDRGIIRNCSASGRASAGSYIGGLVGNNEYGKIYSCYAVGAVRGGYNDGRGPKMGYGLGGLVGVNVHGEVIDCYSEGAVSGIKHVGGLTGDNTGAVLNCYSVGKVSGTDDVGGLVGYGPGGATFNSYWDVQTSGRSSSAGGTGKTTAEMKTASTFVGWGFEPIWTIDEGVDYPHLVWEGLPGQTMTTEPYALGSGTMGDPYLIYTAEQLNAIGVFAHEWGKCFRLMADIDLSEFTGNEFNIIGHPKYLFRGVFEGNNHTISNFTYSCSDKSSIGLFRCVSDANALIKDVSLTGVDIDAGTGGNVGSLIGCLSWSGGEITGCYTKDGRVAGGDDVGGLVGRSEIGTVSNCYSAVSVSGGVRVGGLVGFNRRTTISECDSVSSVSGNGKLGGLVGENHGIIDRSSFSGSISATGGAIGGLVGYSGGGGITRSYAIAYFSGGGAVGGLVGSLWSGNLSQCYSEGSVSATAKVGGLVGYSDSSISQCYSGSDVSGSEKVGGVVGDNHGKVTRSYSTGRVTGTTKVGGLVGSGSAKQVENSFWDIEVSGQTNSAGGTGLATVEMKAESTFTSAGWDFNTPIWTIDDGNDYPRLWWENAVPVGCIVGGDRVVGAGGSCEASVTLDGSCSSDEDSTEGTNDDINDFDWYEVIDACEPNSYIWLGSGEVIECNLGLGEHLIILEVSDKVGAFDSNEVVITVEDTTPPEFSLWVEPNVLWPPNHTMVLITPGWEVSDNCDEWPEVTLVSITSSEEDNAKGDGDGDTTGDILVDPNDGSIYLRAERTGSSSGRIYTITYEAVDDSNNVTVASATVTVPHDQRRHRHRYTERTGESNTNGL